MTTRLEAHMIREALFTSRLAAADTPLLYRGVYMRLNVAEQELILQAGDALQARVPGLGPGGSLELLAKLGQLFVEMGVP